GSLVLTYLGAPTLLLLCLAGLRCFARGRALRQAGSLPIRASRAGAGALGIAALAVFACLQIGHAVLPRLEYVQQHHTRFMPDVTFVREYLNTVRSSDAQRLPTVYCSLGRVEYVWLDLRSKCFFDWWQTGGFIFHRETAMEGER